MASKVANFSGGSQPTNRLGPSFSTNSQPNKNKFLEISWPPKSYKWMCIERPISARPHCHVTQEDQWQLVTADITNCPLVSSVYPLPAKLSPLPLLQETLQTVDWKII